MRLTQAHFESFLNDISVCFLNDDLALWQSRLIMPFSVIVKTGPIVLATPADVETNFNHYKTASAAMELDLIVRNPVSLEDCQDGTWLGTFETRLVSRGQLATAPYTATALLQVDAGRVRMSSMLNGRGHSDWTGEFGT